MGLANNRNAKFLVENKAKAADGTYSIYVLSDGVIYAPKDSMDLFRNMKKLESLEGLENWDTRKVEGFYEMFSCCYKLEVLDLSSFVTTSLTDAYRNFNNCTNLKTIYVGDGWDMSKVTSSAAMFSDCKNLVGGNGTTYMGSDLKYACVDTPAVVDEEGNVITEAIPGYLTYKAAEKTFP
jgi:surface protein